ncbi:transmembrane protein 201-like isoform X1 [Saccostrea cucullata]|uniref:transmembrane protein 201-like isoform X1 n=1 Tax=Saccostrea cuccullata TaxID=36930 RepID=UPI002ECFCDEE
MQMPFTFCTHYLILAVFLIIIIVSFAVYKYVRPRYPVRVNCWFCSDDTVVPYGNRNCWDCPSCQQYNGFNKDGDYNKPIPTQYNGDLNHPVSCVQSDFISKTDVLCEKCSRNQLLKTKQLAAFVPMNEANFDTEVTEFERYLEKLYRLCPDCQTVVNKELFKQDELLQEKLDNYYSETSPLPTEDSQIQVPGRAVHRTVIVGRIMEVVSAVCSLLLFFVCLSSILDLRQYLRHSDYLTLCLTSINEHKRLIGVIGLFSSIIDKIAVGKNRLCLSDALQIPVWLSVLFIQQGTSATPVVVKAEPVLLFCNLVVSSLCCISGRKSRTAPSISIRRLSLDLSKSSSCPSDTSRSTVLYSASQVGDQERSEVMEEDQVDLDDTLSELEAVSLGQPGSQAQNGLFSSSFTNSSHVPSNFSNSSIAQALREKRPLISPAKLKFSLQNRSSTPKKFQATKPKSQFSVSQGSHLLAESKNLFLPHSSQKRGSLSTVNSSFTSPRLTESSINSSVLRKFQSKQLSQTENSERYSDDSESSHQTSVCPVDSTTKQTAGLSIREFLKSPGFVGFILGASVIGNIALAIYIAKVS